MKPSLSIFESMLRETMPRGSVLRVSVLRESKFRRLCLITMAGLMFAMAHGQSLQAQTPAVDPGLTVHEWGTFTSIAGSDGRAARWHPVASLNGSSDLPEFVERFRNGGFKVMLRGTVRMETPVLYFYSSHDATVQVKVTFSKGLITEWYPHASKVNPDTSTTENWLYEKQADGGIAWNSVTLEPGERDPLPVETGSGSNHYYAARQTSATSLRVKGPRGDQREKFLFYRGVSIFTPPLAATVKDDGKLAVKNLTSAEIPSIVLFERRGGKVGYRVSGALANQAEVLLDPPQLSASVDSLRDELEAILVRSGLYRDEAHAMLETWRDSWFEEGSRVFYIVPAGFVNSILPLSIQPAPAQTVRVFVGRMEVVTRATMQAVQAALASNDQFVLGKYQRFLEPIEQMIQQKKMAALGIHAGQDSRVPAAVVHMQ
jgi:hypothetical protein